MKQLETEYKNAISSELPDLWSRIEAGVDEYEASKKANDQAININDYRKNNNKAIIYIKRFSVAAASILVLAVVIKAFSLGGAKSASPTAMSDAAAPAAAYEEAAGDNAEYAAEAAAEAEATESYEEADYEAAAEATAEMEESADESASFKASEAAAEEVNDHMKDAATLAPSLNEVTDSLVGVWDIDEATAAQFDAVLLAEAGIRKPAEYTYVSEDVKRSSLPYGVKSGMDYLRFRFKDATTGEKFILTLVRTGDSTPEILNVVKDEEPFTPVYEADKMTEE